MDELTVHNSDTLYNYGSESGIYGTVLMIIGIPKEIKDNEYRVALPPHAVRELVRHGHEVLVQRDAGAGSAFSDAEYRQAGGRVLESAAEVWQQAEMILKVKEPQPSEYGYLREDLILFTYLHLAASMDLTQAMLDSGVTGLAYETVEDRQGRLPLLQPMSEVAGRMATQIVAHYLEKPSGGRGILMGGVPGVKPAHIVILGAGTVGNSCGAGGAGHGRACDSAGHQHGAAALPQRGLDGPPDDPGL